MQDEDEDEDEDAGPAVAQARVWQVRLGPGGPALAVPADRTLLAAAEAAGWDWPSSCRNGSCRSCLQRLAAGMVRYTVDWPGVLAEEQREGWILPCVACPASDLVVQAPGAHELPVT